MKNQRFEDNIATVEEVIGYTFSDKSLLTQAFTRTSFCNERNRQAENDYQSNEVLEFFGDSILSGAIISFLIRDFSKRYSHGIRTDLTEGDFSNIKSKLSDKKNLSRSMRELGLQKYLRMGEGDEKLGIENEPSVMEDLFESIIGAIYIDCGMQMETVMKSVSRMLDVTGYLSDKTPPMQSYKNALQEYCADKSRRLPPPIYETVSETGPDHRKLYRRACRIGDRVYGIGEGKNQKIADTAAAEAALRRLTEEEKAGILTVVTPDAGQSACTPLRTLYEYAAKTHTESPAFSDLGQKESDDPAAPPIFSVKCRYASMTVTADGPSKKAAKQTAAKMLLDRLHIPINSEKM